jgi:fucokinase
MNIISHPWDYLIVTASNDAQASSYQDQLSLRQKLGLISGVKRVMVVADPQGQRIGSGGSTISALLQVLNREIDPTHIREFPTASFEEILNRLRILIIHAGGDSRRLPAYGPCGKILIPIPGQPAALLDNTIFDRQFPIYRDLPLSKLQQGHVVVTTGDVLLFFSPDDVKFRGKGVTGLGCSISPEQAKDHGVFCAHPNGEVEHFLQKPSPEQQKEKGAIDRNGQTLLDIGVMELDTTTAVKLVELCDITVDHKEFNWTGPITEEIMSKGLDFYREICCAMGKKAQFPDYVKTVRASGSKLSESSLQTIFESFSATPFHVHSLRECTFLHFGTPRQLIETGLKLKQMETRTSTQDTLLNINNKIYGKGRITGSKSWVEGCCIRSELRLEGDNVVVGLDVDSPLSLPAKSCLDIVKGHSRSGDDIWFVRIYGTDDVFKDPLDAKAFIGNHPAPQWLEWMKAGTEEIWDPEIPARERNLWNAKIFPAVSSPEQISQWLWMLNPSKATSEQIQTWHRSDKYSLAEISHLVTLEDFFFRRQKNRTENIRGSFKQIFDLRSGFSAKDLAFIFESQSNEEIRNWIVGILEEAKHTLEHSEDPPHLDRLRFSRILHSLGSAVERTMQKKEWTMILQSVSASLAEEDKKWLNSFGLDTLVFQDAKNWCEKALESAFDNLSQTIVWSRKRSPVYPKCAVRPDEIIWGRAPARLDLGGGWTDTPPYALEHGGCVINAAVNLNGQPPIHVYARVVEEPVIRMTSIDHGLRVTVKDLEDLLDYRKATSAFGLAKAALALSGFSLERATWPEGVTTLKDMLELFGGGIELTTLAAIPSGSGLGTSSIMGAVLMSVINRMIGKKIEDRELFNSVLQLEQELTTGGGWQDQIGGTVAGVKMITTEAGLIPDPKIQFADADALDPRKNQGQTLLYYTGMRRLAKNILRNIVGHYFSRDRATLDTLHKLHTYPPKMVEALSNKDMKRFGQLIDLAWSLNNRIDPDSSNPEIESILLKFKPYMHGAKLLGAGGGGFLLVVCKSAADAEAAMEALETEPPNPLARFFDYDISQTGLEVTVC